MPNMQKVACSDIKLGMCFTMPVFFDDGKNMFLAKRRPVKNYHLKALSQWNIPFLLTAGSVVTDSTAAMEKSFVGFAKAGTIADDDIAELEEVDDVEELEELEEI
ncbi:phosphohydrolase [Treponema sp.]|uniref:phosphohydrolase n=1 Tax=Treponema sp. TaxID=166 RepID=UPI00298E20D2|nr:phosphohydrolase [Treponema sp.]MCR5614388.1 phosphohydrolase [Treponema sp.]